MIGVKKQQNLLLSIARELKKPITIFAIGGTAMMFLGFKDATLDIDLVFNDEDDRQRFVIAAKKLGYKEIDPIKVYGVKRNQPVMLRLNDERFDLFVNEVIDFTFSDNMKDRAGQTHQFGETLILKIADPHDIILMKCATDRIKDLDDALNIIRNKKIDWEIIVKEAENQIKLGRERAAMELGFFIEKLSEKIGIPKETGDKLWKIVAKQSEEKQKKS